MTTFGRVTALAVLLFSTAAAAAGEPSPADVATGRELYKQGADALDRGDATTAVDKLTQAWALVPTPVIGLDLAKAQAALGHVVEAREAALAVSRLTVARNETARSAEARTEADALASRLAPRLAHVKITLKGAGPDDDVTVKVDGATVPRVALAVERLANPGAHKATADVRDGRHAEASVTLREGETREIVVELPPPKPTENVTPTQIVAEPVKPQPIVQPASHAHATSPLTWVGVVTAGVGVATGALTLAFGLYEASIVKSHCTFQSPIDNKFVCGPDYVGDLNAANALGTVATIGFVVAGAGLGVMVAGLVIGGKKSDGARARVIPMFGPISGVAGVF